MSIKQYFTKIPTEINDTSESSDMDLSSEQEINIELPELPNNNHKYITKKYKISKKKPHFGSKKTGVFQKEWSNIYSWLIYDASKNLMFCSLCKFHNKQNKFGKEGDYFY